MGKVHKPSDPEFISPSIFLLQFYGTDAVTYYDSELDSMLTGCPALTDF
jgi:hypothetical protein